MWCGLDFNAGSLAPELEFQTLWYTHSISRCLAAYQYTCPGRENLLRTRKLGGNSGCNTYVKGKGRDVIFKEGLPCVAFITFTVFYGLPYALWYYWSFYRRTISGLERLGDVSILTDLISNETWPHALSATWWHCQYTVQMTIVRTGY